MARSRHGARSLVGRLFDGPLDVIGDVHGEHDALESLLDRLGYDAVGRHPRGRRLVFVGDLCDRGPDSPAVVQRVRELVATGRAQAILGNHEFNLLRGERRAGNHWYFGETCDPAHPEFGSCVPLVPELREDVRAFLDTLPLALERDDLRVVHAAWDADAVARCRDLTCAALDAYRGFELELEMAEEGQRLKAGYEEALGRLGPRLASADDFPGPQPAIGAYDEYYQTRNPLRVMTSGLERAIHAPFHAAGKWRFVERVVWWRSYADVPVLFGHYWRWWNPAAREHLSRGEPTLFADDAVGPEMHAAERAFCIDFSVGVRFKERLRGARPPFQGRLAAMRWPERELVYDAPAPPRD